MLLLPLLSTLFLSTSAQDLQCHVQGQCYGILLTFPPVETYNLCLEACKNTDNCNWLTFYEDTKECILLYDCPEVEANCNNCYSGQVACEPKEPECNIHGTCIGHFVAISKTDTANDCLLFCQSIPECNWYSYNFGSKDCALTEDCLILDESCQNCVVGEASCGEGSVSPLTKLFAVGGYGGASNKVEMVDLSGNNNNCPNIANYAAGEWGSVGTFINNQVMVCGGNRGDAIVKTCSNYNATDDSWALTYPMTHGRIDAAAVQLSDTKWWVTGGYETFSLRSTEVFTVGEGFSPYVDLPTNEFYHNLVKINDSYVMLLGGASSTDIAYLFSTESETWTQIPNLLLPIAQSQAGLAIHSDGRREVVVAASESQANTQIFSLDSMTWRLGPNFPLGNLEGAASVPRGNSFLVIGGYSSGIYQSSMYNWNVEDEQWEKMEEELTLGRAWFSAFMVSEDLIACALN